MNSLKEKIFILISLTILYADSASSPPLIPTLQVVVNHEQVILRWDKTSERSIDSLTGYSDFEGYRLYRSTDGGVTWGNSKDRIFDYSGAGNIMGWQPYAQFDLNSTYDSLHCNYNNGYFGESGERCYSLRYSLDSLEINDPELLDNYTSNEILYNDDSSFVYLPEFVRGSNISGFDPMASWVNLGDTDSLKRIFVDTEVIDGVEYTYALTAYDMGMISFNVVKNILYDNINTAEADPPSEVDCDHAVDNIPFYNKNQCESMLHCYWDVNTCIYSDKNYCDGDDSHCGGSDFCCENLASEDVSCDGDDSYCQGGECSGGGCEIDGSLHPTVTQALCSALGIALTGTSGVWVEYSTQKSCERAGNPPASSSFSYEWTQYSDQITCETEDHDWVPHKYLDAESCKSDLHGFSLLEVDEVDDATDVYIGFGGCAQVIGAFGQSCDDNFAGANVWEECPVTCGTLVGCDTMIELNLTGESTGISDILISGSGGVEIPFTYFDEGTVNDACTMDINSVHITSSGNILYNTATPIYGFQFNIDDANVDTAFGGNSASAGFKISFTDYEWKEVIYSDKTTCQDADYDWTLVEYSDEESCELVHGYSLPVAGIGIDDPTGIYADVGGCDGVINTLGMTCDVEYLGYTISNICPVKCGYTIAGCDTMIVLDLDGVATGLSDINISGPGGEGMPFNYDATATAACTMAPNSIHITEGGTVLYNTDTPILGFEFNVIGANVDTAFGGNSESAGFMTSADYEWNTIYFSSDTTWSSRNPGRFPGRPYTSGYDELWGYPSFESPRLYESLTDYNSNGKWDYGEEYTDENNNGIWDKRINLINVATVLSGHKASNITYPDDDDLVVPDPTNRGNGDRFYEIVNENLLTDAVLRFEINAGLNLDNFGDSTGSFATLDPALYCYEALGLDNFNPKSTYVLTVAGMDAAYIDSLLGLPGVVRADTLLDGSITKLNIPNYKIEDFKLTTIDDGQHTLQVTDWFDGIRFRFDNGPNSINYVTPEYPPGIGIVDFQEVKFSRSSLSDLFKITNTDRFSMTMKYKDDKTIRRRPSYTYKIEFSTSYLDTVVLSSPGGACNDFPGVDHALLPFRVINLSTGRQVKLRHFDKGVIAGYLYFSEFGPGDCTASQCPAEHECFEGNCIKREGYKDCNWERNEYFLMEEYVYSTNDVSENFSPGDNLPGLDGDIENTFFFKIDFNFFQYADKYFNNFAGWTDWYENVEYNTSEIVFHEGMLYKALRDNLINSPPSDWFMDAGSWQMLYPWNDGDYVIIEPYGWYQDGDAWVADLSLIGNLDGNSSDDLQNISVVPNPYIVNSNYFNESPGHHLMRFTNLPTDCIISIYTISGKFVTRFTHNDSFDGNEWWNIKNEHNRDVAPGLYIYVVETPSGEKKIDKFAIVR